MSSSWLIAAVAGITAGAALSAAAMIRIYRTPSGRPGVTMASPVSPSQILLQAILQLV